MVTLKTAWNNVMTKAKVQWHDNRHTLITDPAESGAGDETVRDIVGHVSKADVEVLFAYPHKSEADSTAINRGEEGRLEAGGPHWRDLRLSVTLRA